MGRQPCCDKVGLKKGPWTGEEDQKLINFILTNGQCCWRAVPKLAGLLRCGKSCRLRWTNYLRPDLKRGLLSEYEEKMVIDLHAKLGNRHTQPATIQDGGYSQGGQQPTEPRPTVTPRRRLHTEVTSSPHQPSPATPEATTMHRDSPQALEPSPAPTRRSGYTQSWVAYTQELQYLLQYMINRVAYTPRSSDPPINILVIDRRTSSLAQTYLSPEDRALDTLTHIPRDILCGSRLGDTPL
ncbi:hypothetical protein F511_08596 [Dorcoceras hygrometricum]|uniref:Uncharacterized protein n=1 Tax=Dorcoceras hygrometricum TaxID=472368 RepID=A0A2Z7D4C2_9LAMI|nr:hypothetical protein F511_08596 [Dorcoceras hygrometricum]